MKKILFIILFFTNNLFAQNIKVKGILVESETTEPIEYATITSLKSNSTTFSNSNGQFELIIQKGDTLKLSSIGFKNKYIQILGENEVVIKLEREVKSLEEIIISADTIYKVVDKAFALIKKNYPTSKYHIDAFYREFVKNDNKYVRLVEAAVSETDFGFQKPIDKQKLRVDEIRKSVDNISRSWQSKVITFLFGNTNTLIVSKFNGDFIRRYSENKKLALNDPEEFLKHYEFTYLGMTNFDNQQLYKIQINLPANRDKGQFKGFIYINKKDFGIVRFAYSFSTPSSFSNSSNQNENLMFRSYLTSYDAYYRKVGTKYYLSRIKTVLPVNWDAINKETMSGFQFFHTDFITVNIYTKSKDFERIKRKEIEKRAIDLYDTDTKFNKTFWENYPVLMENPIENQAKIDLNTEF